MKPGGAERMTFVQINGLKGKVYIPDEKPNDRKKQRVCEDCYACQMCSDTRCTVCLGQKTCIDRKPSSK